MQSFTRFFNEELSFDVMLQRIKEMIAKTPSWVGKILQFAVLVGLRPSEVCESVRLICKSTDKYYNPERQALEHFKFSQFIRTTKKAYLSFVTPEMLEGVRYTDQLLSPTYNQIRLACWSAGIKCDMRYARKIFASHLRNEGIQPEIVDLLSGRVPQSVLVRHYLVPSPTYKDDVLRALTKLKEKLES